MQKSSEFFNDLTDIGVAARPRRQRVAPRPSLAKRLPLRWPAGLLAAFGSIAILPLGLDPGSAHDARSVSVPASSTPLRPRQIITVTRPDQSPFQIVTAAIGLAETRAPADAPSSKPATDLQRQSVSVRSGDTLEGIFTRLGLPAREAYVIAEHPDATDLARLRPGRELSFTLDKPGALQTLEYRYRPGDFLRVSRVPGQAKPHFEVSRVIEELETRHRVVHAEIQSSLFRDGEQAGLPDALIMQLVGIFGWDIDFALDLRQGDHFSVVWEERFLHGSKVSEGDIVAAEFVNRGAVHRAIVHRDEEGRTRYYSPEGMSMRKTFLRTPVEFSRISSGFSRKRYHPVLKRWRAHRGVDYAAPRGTPVVATADGRVYRVGNEGGYGRRVILRHGGQFSTVYAHLSRYRRGLKAGQNVHQGEVIGYVGSSGLATGPHLHYEFRVAGEHVNPLKFRPPRAQPIDKRYRQQFLANARSWSARLDALAGEPPTAAQISQQPSPTQPG